MATGLVLDTKMARHATRAGHPESSQRITGISDALQSAGLTKQCLRLPTVPIDLRLLELCHTPAYIERFRAACASGHSQLDCNDCSMSRETFEVARESAGSVITAIDAVMTGQVMNAYCGVRPPGHHALADQAMGFCYFGNAAIGARYLLERYKLNRVLVFDWDVHHGNGTQALLESEPRVMFCSIHGDPANPSNYYPGTGFANEIGKGAAEGNTINIPMPLQSSDGEYKFALARDFFPRVEAFAPEFIIISAGFDAHHQDPMKGMELSTEFFGWATDKMTEYAARYCQGRLISVQEGGYNVRALGECVVEHKKSLLRASHK